MMTTTTNNLLTAALTLGLVTASTLVELGAEHGNDEAEILAYIDECAEARMHDDRETRAAWIAARDAVRYLESGMHLEPADRFGFKAEATARATAALALVGIPLP